MPKSFEFYLFALCAITHCELALAQTQKQTPQDAQAFLKKVHEGPGFAFNWRFRNIWSGGLYNNQIYTVGPDKVVQVSSPSPCQTDLKIISKYKIVSVMPLTYSTRDEVVSINWSQVGSVKKDGANVEWKQPDAYYRLEFASESWATRAEFAMEFLRMSCDAAAETGF